MQSIMINGRMRARAGHWVVPVLLSTALMATAGCKEPNLKPNEIEGSGAPGDSVSNLGPCNAANAGKAQCVDGTIQVCESRGALSGFQIGRRCFLGGEVCVEFGSDEAACTRNEACADSLPQCTVAREAAPGTERPALPRNSAVTCAGTLNVQTVESCGFSGRCIVDAGTARCQPAAEVFSEAAVCDWYNRRQSRYDIVGTTNLAVALASTDSAEVAVEDVPMTLSLAAGETRYLRLNAVPGVGGASPTRNYVILVDINGAVLDENGALLGGANTVTDRIAQSGRINPACTELTQNQEYADLPQGTYAIELKNPSTTASTRLTVMVTPKDTTIDRVCDREELVGQVYYRYLTRAQIEDQRANALPTPSHILTPELVALAEQDLTKALADADRPREPFNFELDNPYFSPSYSLSFEVPHVVEVPPDSVTGSSYLNFSIDLSQVAEDDSATLLVYGREDVQVARIAYRLEEAVDLANPGNIVLQWVGRDRAEETPLTAEVPRPFPAELSNVTTNEKCNTSLPDGNTRAFNIIKDLKTDANPPADRTQRIRRPYVVVFSNSGNETQTVRLILIRAPAGV